MGITTAFIEDSNFIRYGLAAYYGIGAVCQLGLLFGMKFVKNFYCVHDLVCGHIIFIPLFILAILKVPHRIQTWLLYQNALSSDVVVSNILRYARKSQESGGTSAPNKDLVEQIAKLSKVVQKQEQTIENLGSSGGLKSKQNASTCFSDAWAVNRPQAVSVASSYLSIVSKDVNRARRRAR